MTDEVRLLIVAAEMPQPFLEALGAIRRFDPRMVEVATGSDGGYEDIAVFG